MSRYRIAAVHKPPVVIAIPAKDEAEMIGGCLMALNRQAVRPDIVVLLVNNSSDGTASVANALIGRLAFRLIVAERCLAASVASAGHARRLAMELAWEHAGPDGVLMTTDADSIPPPGWVGGNLAAIRHGADLVCGRAVIDPADAGLIPAHLHLDDRLERELIGLLDGLAWVLDPEAHDPPPRHTEASGASLALTAATFHAVGGVPPMFSGEDRALAQAVWKRDGRLRHDPAITVTVSGRLTGRAAGGMAETISRRVIHQDEFTDQQVEPALNAWERYTLRRRVRQYREQSKDPTLADDLAVSREALRAAVDRPHFGAAWTAVEAISPRLVRQRVRFANLRREIENAYALLPPDAMAAD